MNVEDVDVAWAERDSSPTRARSYDPQDRLDGEYERIHTERESRQASRAASQISKELREEPVEEVEEVEESPIRHRDGPHGTPNETGSVSSSASSVSSVRRTRQRHMSTISKASTRLERDIMEYLDRHPTAVARVEQHRLQHMQTVGSTRFVSKEGVELPDFGGKKPYPPPLPEREEYVVEFSGFDDPRHAQNFTMKKKLIISCVLVFFSLAATFASSIFSAAGLAVGQKFDVGREVVTLGTSLL